MLGISAKASGRPPGLLNPTCVLTSNRWWRNVLGWIKPHPYGSLLANRGNEIGQERNPRNFPNYVDETRQREVELCLNPTNSVSMQECVSHR